MAFYKPKVGILPADRSQADNKWLNEKLSYLNDKDREKVCNAYSKAFREAVENEPIAHKKENAGRYAANTKLRIFIKNRFAVFNRR